MEISWTIKTFPELTIDELYNLLRLRNEVFIVEQNCPFPDLDGKDRECHHLLGCVAETNELVACTRLMPPGLAYQYASIGRVVTAATARRSGQGRALMERSIQEIERYYGPVPIEIGAQRYLEKFYESFGFKQIGAGYLEDGIQHIHMLRDV